VRRPRATAGGTQVTGLSRLWRTTYEAESGVADDRLCVLFGFAWNNQASGGGFGNGWTVARFAKEWAFRAERRILGPD